MSPDLAVIDYLMQNKGYDYLSRSLSAEEHESLVNLVNSNPVRFGLPRNVTFYREVHFDGRPAIPHHGVIDLVALVQDDSVPQEIYLLEVKSVNSKGASAIATNQLHNAFYFFYEKFGIMPHLRKVFRSKGSSSLGYTLVKPPINPLDALYKAPPNNKI